MKSGIHPKLHQTKVVCVCGATYTITGTLEELHTEICMNCHPHYTGKSRLVDTEGRVDKFMSKFNKAKEGASVAKEDAPVKEKAAPKKKAKK